MYFLDSGAIIRRRRQTTHRHTHTLTHYTQTMMQLMIVDHIEWQWLRWIECTSLVSLAHSLMPVTVSVYYAVSKYKSTLPHAWMANHDDSHTESYYAPMCIFNMKIDKKKYKKLAGCFRFVLVSAYSDAGRQPYTLGKQTKKWMRKMARHSKWMNDTIFLDNDPIILCTHWNMPGACVWVHCSVTEQCLFSTSEPFCGVSLVAGSAWPLLLDLTPFSAFFVNCSLSRRSAFPFCSFVDLQQKEKWNAHHPVH